MAILEKLFYSFGLIVIGLFVGQSIKLARGKGIIKETVPVDRYISLLQRFVLLGLNPIVIIGTFWNVKVESIRFFMLPLIGIGIVTLGGTLGFFASKLMKKDRRQTGSMLVSGAFTNLGAFGGLISFALLGDSSYVYVSMVRLLEEFTYYSVGYPVAKLFGDNYSDGNTKKSKSRNLFLDPFILVSFLSIAIGTAMNLSGLARPEAYKTVNNILIPLTSTFLVITVGFNMRLNAFQEFIKEGFAIALIKMLIVPAVITSIAYVAGFGSMDNGMILKVVLIMSAMPPAFMSLIPPQLYGLDTDLSNSCWLFGTIALVVELPVLFLLCTVI